jgi:hypothetical protein
MMKFEAALTHGDDSIPVPIVFSTAQANEAMAAGSYALMICVAVPRAMICTCVADAQRFFDEPAP